MKRTSGHLRAIVALLLPVVLACAAGLWASSAHADPLSPEKLRARGWTCFSPPPPAPNVTSCFNPGHGRPFPGNPDPPPSYTALVFDRASGEFLTTAHLIRADLYAGQPCAGGEPYRFIPLIGYYECARR